jgi:F0F1-type ATP synthase assembly protein I
VRFEDGALAATASCGGAGRVLLAMSEVPIRGYRLVVRVVLLQAGCAALVALLFFAYRGSSSGIAALAGGLIVAVGSAVFGWRAFAPGIAGAARLSRAMFAGVALKWLWFVLALYLALARLKLDAVPLLVGLATAQFGYWFGMIRLK